MSESDRSKPLPVRPPPAPPGELPPEAEASEPPPPEQSDPATADEPEEVDVTWQGRLWVARVLGRSGRASARSAPLMLVGFRDAASGTDGPMLEGILPGRRLADVPEEELRAILARAKPPPAVGQKRPFFEDSDPTRRSGPAGEY